MLPLYGGGFLVALSQLTAFYYVTAALLHFVLPAWLPVKGVQVQERTPGDVSRDAFNSLGPIMVKAAIWTMVEHLHRSGVGLLYDGPVNKLHQVLYIALCTVALDYLHDTWFYLTHRLLHWRPLYKHVHYEHHISKAPSAFTGYSFHVAEALLVFANEVLVCFMLPLHMGLHRWYHLLTTIIHEAGHAGYEIAPFIPTLEGILAAALTRMRGSKAFNTVQHHDMHHRYPSKHFSLYFTHWDRLFGTMHPKYDEDLFTYFGPDSTTPKQQQPERQQQPHAAGS